MPIEIRELVIRATVDPKPEGTAGGCGSSAQAKDSSRAHAAAVGDDLVQSCVREVLRILEDKRER
jgi:hypothetical protein